MKHALVFGGSGYLGASIVRYLRSEGYSITCAYRSRKPSFEPDTSVLCCCCDIGSPAEVASFFLQAKAAFGAPQVVINAAGTALKQALLTDTAPQDIESVIRTDLLGALYISREAAPLMHKAHSGSIIHISSLWGSIGASCEVPYSAAKGGLNTMVKALAKELAPDGIRVNAIAPGLILSPMNAHLSKDDLSLFRSETPLNCYITPEDVIRSIQYLIDSPHVTGQILSVDGGIVI